MDKNFGNKGETERSVKGEAARGHEKFRHLNCVLPEYKTRRLTKAKITRLQLVILLFELFIKNYNLNRQEVKVLEVRVHWSLR